MKTAISIPDELFAAADAFAARAGKSRSEVYADALRDHLRRQGDPAVTALLDNVYADLDVRAEDRDWLGGVADGIVARNSW